MLDTLIDLVNKVPGLVVNCYESLAEIFFLTISTINNGLSYLASVINSILYACISYYQENERKPRLISAMLKQMIYN